MKPLFSIITVTWNAEKTIGVTLASVKEQTCRLFEYIVMDGVSADHTLKLALNAGISEARIYSSRDNGIYDAMNNAMEQAQGDYLIFLNAGDTFHSADTLEQIAQVIMNNDYPGIVYGQTNLVDSQRNYLGPRHLTAPDRLTFDSFANGMVVCHQAFVVLRKLAQPYDLRYRYSADYDWCIRCLQKSKRNVMVPGVLIDYLSEGTTTANRRASLKERFRIMCYYYGTLPTMWRHVKFLPRFLNHRKQLKNAKSNLQQ